MNFISKHIHYFGILLLTLFLAIAACLYFGVPTSLLRVRASSQETGKQTYTCPMHPEIIQDHPGQCPKCTMSLIPTSAAAQMEGCEDHASGCCSKPAAATRTLPPGHPPVPGYSEAKAEQPTR